MTFYDSGDDILRLDDSKQAPAEAFLFILSFLMKSYAFDATAFMQERGMQMQALQVKGAMIRASYINELIEEAMRLSGDAGLLFQFAESVTPNNLGVLGYLMLHSSNIEEAIFYKFNTRSKAGTERAIADHLQSLQEDISIKNGFLSDIRTLKDIKPLLEIRWERNNLAGFANFPDDFSDFFK